MAEELDCTRDTVTWPAQPRISSMHKIPWSTLHDNDQSMVRPFICLGHR